MSAFPRIDPLGAAVLCLLLGAAAIPAFARNSTSHHVPRGGSVAPAASPVDATTRAIPEEPRATGLDALPASERADTSTGISGELRIHLLPPGIAPAGVYQVPGGVGREPFAFIGQVPFSAKQGGSIGGYHVGYWPAELHAVQSDAYDNPAGFVEVTADNADVPVSAHFTLGDFVTHDGAPFPRYIVLRERLLDKLELVLSDLEVHGVATDHVELLSAFRTPAYNLALGDASGRARESRHQYGDAVDMIIDADGDGRMDDLNGDGRADVADVRVIESAVNRVERAHPELAGGLGLYREMGPSGPFAHIDVRGSRARWGSADRPAYADGGTSSARHDGVRTTEPSQCQAEGASAVLCQGIGHRR